MTKRDPARSPRSARALAARFVPQRFVRQHGRLYVARRVTAMWLRRHSGRARRGASAPAFIAATSFLDGARPGEVREAFPGEHVELAPPPDPGSRFSRIPGWYPSDRWRLEHDIAPERVLQLQGGVVFGGEGWIGPDRGRVIADWNTYWRTDAEIARAVDGAVARGVLALNGTTASLLQLGWDNYFHWMIQGLPRLLTLVDTNGPDIDRFLVGPPRPFVVESLDRLSIDPGRRQQVKAKSPAFECDVLVSAALPDVYTPPARWAVERVRSLFPPAEGGGNGPRIYVERGATPRRRVVNEDDVRALLDRRGFVTVSMDGRSVAEQAALFAAAEVVVSVHGAALTNLVFARPGARVVELLPANDPKPLFWHLARTMDLDYDLVVGTEPALRRQHDVWMNDADTVVDLAELGRVVG